MFQSTRSYFRKLVSLILSKCEAAQRGNRKIKDKSKMCKATGKWFTFELLYVVDLLLWTELKIKKNTITKYKFFSDNHISVCLFLLFLPFLSPFFTVEQFFHGFPRCPVAFCLILLWHQWTKNVKEQGRRNSEQKKNLFRCKTSANWSPSDIIQRSPWSSLFFFHPSNSFYIRDGKKLHVKKKTRKKMWSMWSRPTVS